MACETRLRMTRVSYVKVSEGEKSVCILFDLRSIGPSFLRRASSFKLQGLSEDFLIRFSRYRRTIWPATWGCVIFFFPFTRIKYVSFWPLDWASYQVSTSDSFLDSRWYNHILFMHFWQSLAWIIPVSMGQQGFIGKRRMGGETISKWNRMGYRLLLSCFERGFD